MNYPNALDNFSNPSANTKMDDIPHATQHSDANDAIEALEAKVGTDGSADTDSVDHKLATVISDLNTDEGNLSTHIADTANPHAVTKAQVGLGSVDNNSLSTILQAVYPVGSIYITITATNPATVFGFGTWVAFGTGRTLVGIDTGQTEFDTVEETGGHKALQQHNHGNTGGQSADHDHNLRMRIAATSGGYVETVGYGNAAAAASVSAAAIDGASNNHTHATVDAGAGNAQNLQPYITVYMFKRQS